MAEKTKEELQQELNNLTAENEQLKKSLEDLSIRYGKLAELYNAVVDKFLNTK